MFKENRDYKDFDFPVKDAPEGSYSICKNCVFTAGFGEKEMEGYVFCCRILNWIDEKKTCDKWRTEDIILENQEVFKDLIAELKAGFHHDMQIERYYRDLSKLIKDSKYGNTLFDLDDESEGELIDINKEEFDNRYSTVTIDMRENGSWYYLEGLYKGTGNPDYANADFIKITSAKYLALGRSKFYDNFIDYLDNKYNKKYFQSDYMVWIKPEDPYSSLLFYIDTAETIHFSLEGISIDDLLFSVSIGKRVSNRRELGKNFMTLWEINQILFSDYKNKTVWHIRGVLTKKQVVKVLAPIVNPENIVVD